MARPKNANLREFILQNLKDHEGDIASFAAGEIGVTRAAVNGYLRALVREGLLAASGATKGRRYQFKVLAKALTAVDPKKNPQEEVLWREKFRTHFAGLPENILRICESGFGEIMNNAIHHSEGKNLLVQIERTYARVIMRILDDGVGIFDKLVRDGRLTDKRQAILELSKGGITSDRANHKGEGIFFAARMFDAFIIISGGFEFRRRRTPNGEYLCDVVGKESEQRGTCIHMEIGTSAPQTIKDAFDPHLNSAHRFAKTTIPVKLVQREGDLLVSRTQARDLMRRAEAFEDVRLDFSEINEIGPRFADEVFRTWAAAHPKVALHYVNASQAVDMMIRHARANEGESAIS